MEELGTSVIIVGYIWTASKTNIHPTHVGEKNQVTVDNGSCNDGWTSVRLRPVRGSATRKQALNIVLHNYITCTCYQGMIKSSG